MSDVRCVVLDFDGTFTDVEREAAPFVHAYRAGLAELAGGNVDADWQRVSAAIDAQPERWGWQNGGVIVAPGNADPYVRSTTIAQAILDERGLLPDAAARSAATGRLYQAAYVHTVTAFRPDARETLAAICASGRPAYVVTNARTDVVQHKLAELAPAGGERLRIIGDAGKYVVADASTPDARFAAVPAERRLPGLPRPVYPRRGRYFDALARIWRETGVVPAETLVCGDIFELDLTLPLELGLLAHLVTGPNTAGYERAALATHGVRTRTGDQVSTVLDWLA